MAPGSATPGSAWLQQCRQSTEDGRHAPLSRGEKKRLNRTPQKMAKSSKNTVGEGKNKRGGEISILVKGRISDKETSCDHGDRPSDKCTTATQSVSGRKSGYLSEILLF